MFADQFLITTRKVVLGLLSGVSLTTDPSSQGETFCSSGMAHSSHNTTSSLLVPGGAILQGGQGGMIMYMDGFRFSLLGNNNPCLNLYFPGWTLDTRSKFWWAMMGVVLLGIITEGISKLRSLSSKRLSGFLKRVTITILHGIQALVGYILMLATMTFSIELLACVIVGLGLGFALFYDDEDSHVTTNPCCNFIQNEYNERASTRRGQIVEEEQEAHDYEPPTIEEQVGTGDEHEQTCV